MSAFKAGGLREALTDLRVLSLTSGTRIFGSSSFSPVRASEASDSTSQDADEQNFLGPAYFLALCPNLEELELVHFRLPGADAYGIYERIFDNVVHLVRLPHLLKFKMRGNKINYRAFKQFLNDNQSIKSLDLRFVGPLAAGYVDRCLQRV